MWKPIRKVPIFPFTTSSLKFLLLIYGLLNLAALTAQLAAAQKALSEEKTTRSAIDQSLAEEKTARQVAEQAPKNSDDAKSKLAQELETT
jgi:hypothetical protein